MEKNATCWILLWLSSRSISEHQKAPQKRSILEALKEQGEVVFLPSMLEEAVPSTGLTKEKGCCLKRIGDIWKVEGHHGGGEAVGTGKDMIREEMRGNKAREGFESQGKDGVCVAIWEYRGSQGCEEWFHMVWNARCHCCPRTSSPSIMCPKVSFHN